MQLLTDTFLQLKRFTLAHDPFTLRMLQTTSQDKPVYCLDHSEVIPEFMLVTTCVFVDLAFNPLKVEL